MVINVPKVYGDNVKVVAGKAILICGSKRIAVKELLKPVVRLDGEVIVHETVMSSFSTVSGRRVEVREDVIIVLK